MRVSLQGGVLVDVYIGGGFLFRVALQVAWERVLCLLRFEKCSKWRN